MLARHFGTSVKARLVRGIGLIVGLLIVLALGASWQLKALGSQMERLVDVHGRNADLAHRLHSAQLGWMERLRALMVVSDPEDLKAQAASLEAAKIHYLAAETALSDALHAGGASDASLSSRMAEVRSLREAIAPAYDSATRGMLAGGGADSALVLLIPAETAEGRWRNEISAIVEDTARASTLEYNQAREAQGTATALLLGLASIATGAAIVLTMRIVRSITQPILAAVGIAEAVAQGRLDQPIDTRRADEFGRLALAMSSMQDKLKASVQGMQHASDAVLTASQEIGAGSRELSRRTEETAARLQETTAAVRRLNEALAASVSSAHQASQEAGGARHEAQMGDAALLRLQGQMQHVTNVSQRITEIVETIDGIAFQTNVLALNASVEAAHAGDQGRGFGVVAAEVRQLAQRAAEAAGQIRSLSAETAMSIERGSQSAGEAGDTVTRLVDTAGDVAEAIAAIVATAERQSEMLSRIDAAVLQLDDATQRNAALAEQLAASSQALEARATEVKATVAVFDTGAAEAKNP